MEHAKLYKICRKCKEEKLYSSYNKGRKVCTTCRSRSRSPEKRLYKDAKYRAKKKNIEFSILIDDIKIPEYCPVFGIPLKLWSLWDAPSLDRIDNTKGYTKENIIVVSFKANHFKSCATIDELKKVVKFYENLNSHK